MFSLKSYLSIMFVEQSFYFQSIREIYEVDVPICGTTLSSAYRVCVLRRT